MHAAFVHEGQGLDHHFLNNQTIEVGDAGKGETKARRKAKYPMLISTFDDKIKTMHDVYEQAVKSYADREYLGTREFLPDGKRGRYLWLTYKAAQEKWLRIGAGLVHLGFPKGHRVGIFSVNRTEWVLTDAGCQSQGIVPIALYATLGANAVEFVVNHAELQLIFSDGKNLDKVLSLENCPQMKTVVSYDAVSDPQRKKAEEKGISLMTLDELEKLGGEHPHPITPPSAQDIFTIMYTSGTTGNPKGVMLTQCNVIAELAGILTGELPLRPPEIQETHLSYLPLAHSFERCVLAAVTGIGAQIGFFQGLITELFSDINELKPTFLLGVPRVWQRLHDKLWLTVNNGVWYKRFLFNWGFNSKTATVKGGGTAPMWDYLVFSQMKEKIGGRVRFIISGSAPLDPKLSDFLKVVFCCPIVQGYGLTENMAGLSMTVADDPTAVGHVGPPFACCEVKLVDVPEMNYFSTDPQPRGEVCVRGNNVFIGYYKDPEKTAEDLKPDGWFHTGDIGRFNPNGTLAIIDRKKNIFKLSQGEYVAAEYLEGVFIQNPFVSQIFVYGDSLNNFLVGVVVPEWDYLLPWAQQQGLQTADKEALCKTKQVRELLLTELNKVGKENKLHGFEFLKMIHIEPVAFSEENNLLTPTFKLRRPNLKEHYQTIISEMYAEYKKAHPDV